MHENRLTLLTKAMEEANLDTLLISHPSSIYYYTGYSVDPGERLLLLSIRRNLPPILYLNRLFPQPNALPGNGTVFAYSDGQDVLTQVSEDLEGSHIGVDKFWASHFLLDLMALKPDDTIVNGSPLVDTQRSIKSADEQAFMAQASALNDQAMTQIIAELSKGQSEKDMVQKLGQIYHELGCQGFSFDPIIAYGANAADPHHLTDDSLPHIGDSIVIDIGAIYQGYASDMTRTVFYGEADSKACEVYALVQQANQAAIDFIRPGIPFSQIDYAARKIIEDAGYGEYFTHRLGHFIGMDCHEAGDVSQYNHDVTQVGQIFSIEPGIYLPGQVGVRIEDLVLVTPDGCQVLNQVSKDLHIIDPTGQ